MNENIPLVMLTKDGVVTDHRNLRAKFATLSGNDGPVGVYMMIGTPEKEGATK
jgi:hypothetical protein